LEGWDYEGGHRKEAETPMGQHMMHVSIVYTNTVECGRVRGELKATSIPTRPRVVRFVERGG